MNKLTKCIICGSADQKKLFSKNSAHGEPFNLVECRNCGLEFLSEIPDADELEKYYEKQYFTQRTERGYNNYFSDELKREIERVFRLNLTDLGFHEFEDRLINCKNSLDIGCAAGYFVNYLRDRGWNARGIDVSEDCVNFAQKAGLFVEQGDYLNKKYTEKFQLVTLWATIEHLQNPDSVIEKIYKDLEYNSMLYISTCRTGGINFKYLFGKNWRYYNFPEHIYFFSRKTIKKLLEQNGFRVIKYKTYGSGVGKPGSLHRKVADFIAKKFKMGDMMIVAAVKM